MNPQWMEKKPPDPPAWEAPPGAAAPLLGSRPRRLGGFAAHPPPRTLSDRQALSLFPTMK